MFTNSSAIAFRVGCRLGRLRALALVVVLSAPMAARATTPAPNPTPVACFGDCDGDGAVTVNELIILVNIALGSAPLDACTGSSEDPCYDLPVAVECVITSVNNALYGCPSPIQATPTPTATPVP